MMGKLTIYSDGDKDEPITLRDITDMIESLGGGVSFADSGVDFDLDAPITASVDVDGAVFNNAKIKNLSFQVSGVNG